MPLETQLAVLREQLDAATGCNMKMKHEMVSNRIKFDFSSKLDICSTKCNNQWRSTRPSRRWRWVLDLNFWIYFYSWLLDDVEDFERKIDTGFYLSCHINRRMKKTLKLNNINFKLNNSARLHNGIAAKLAHVRFGGGDRSDRLLNLFGVNSTKLLWCLHLIFSPSKTKTHKKRAFFTH